MPELVTIQPLGKPEYVVGIVTVLLTKVVVPELVVVPDFVVVLVVLVVPLPIAVLVVSLPLTGPVAPMEPPTATMLSHVPFLLEYSYSVPVE